MNFYPTNQIKEIAEELGSGFRVFVHKTTRQVLSIPDQNSMLDIDLDPWNEDIVQLENNFTDYYEIIKWTSSEAFDTMVEFTKQVKDNHRQNKLLEALSKKKPFRGFKFVIDNAGAYREQWFEFRNEWHQNFVAEQLNRLQQIEK